MTHKVTDIEGYRELTQAEIDQINELKALGTVIGDTIKTMQLNTGLDQRWVSIGNSWMQQGIMALVRSVAKPEGF